MFMIMTDAGEYVGDVFLNKRDAWYQVQQYEKDDREEGIYRKGYYTVVKVA